MIRKIDFPIDALTSMKRYPQELFYKGDTTLLHKRKIAIVGSRKPNQYARNKTQELAQKLSQAGVCIVSGGAIGIDAISHKAAGFSNTIVVAATGLDKRYPVINSSLIENIENEGLVLSQFPEGTPSHKYNFVLRNELVVALGESLIVSYADLNSGTMHSVDYALKMGKEVFVLPHRIGESEATNKLLQENKAKAIYDIESFLKGFGLSHETQKDPFLLYCQSNPSYDDVLKKFATRLFESELSGEITVKNGKVFLAP